MVDWCQSYVSSLLFERPEDDTVELVPHRTLKTPRVFSVEMVS